MISSAPSDSSPGGLHSSSLPAQEKPGAKGGGSRYSCGIPCEVTSLQEKCCWWSRFGSVDPSGMENSCRELVLFWNLFWRILLTNDGFPSWFFTGPALKAPVGCLGAVGEEGLSIVGTEAWCCSCGGAECHVGTWGGGEDDTLSAMNLLLALGTGGTSWT